MKTKTRQLLSRTLYTLLLGTCLSLVSVADATAHNTDYRPYVVQRQYVVSRPQSFPRWLRDDRRFQHWYHGNRYRLQRNLSWQRVYDIYYLEKRHRVRNRSYRGRVMYDYGYRTYRERPRKHKHR